jgi:hypothetical protein
MVDRNLNLISIYQFNLVVIVILQRTICRSLQRDGRKGQKREDRSHHGGNKVWMTSWQSLRFRISVVVTRSKKLEFASRWRLFHVRAEWRMDGRQSVYDLAVIR